MHLWRLWASQQTKSSLDTTEVRKPVCPCDDSRFRIDLSFSLIVLHPVNASSLVDSYTAMHTYDAYDSDPIACSPLHPFVPWKGI